MQPEIFAMLEVPGCSSFHVAIFCANSFFYLPSEAAKCHKCLDLPAVMQSEQKKGLPLYQ